MTLKKRLSSIFICLVLSLSLFTYTSFSERNTENMDFTVDVVLPKNQTNEDITYFDFSVKPSEELDLEVIVSNTGKEKKTIRVTPTNAITNNNGIVDYSKQEKKYTYDNTLKTPFTSLVSKEQQIEVEPGKSESLIFHFKAPKEAFDGIILGGFVTDLVDDDEVISDSSKNGIQFSNKFQYVKAAVIRSNDTTVDPNITLNTVQPALHDYKTAITANLQNTAPVLLGDVKVKAEIFEKGTTTALRSEERDDIQFAPNSNFDFPIMWNNERLKPGKYTLELTATVDKKEFSFTEDFSITKAQSNSLNNDAINVEKKELPLGWIIVTVFISILLLVLVYVIYRQRKKKQVLMRDIKVTRNKHIQHFKKNIDKK